MITILYIVSIILAVIIAVLLVYLSRLSGQARVQVQALNASSDPGVAPEPFVAVPAPETKPGDVAGKIQEELSAVAKDDAALDEVSGRIADIVAREVQVRVAQSHQELGRKYEEIITEKTKDQEVVWNKYNQVLEEKRETDAVIRSLAEGVVVVGKDGKVLMMNPAAEKLLGVKGKMKMGKHIASDLKEEQLITLVQGPAQEQDKVIEVSSSNDETKRIIRASSAVIENEAGKTVGMVSVLSDITKHRELERLKSNFVASVSHDLRTPLVAIEKAVSLVLSRVPGPLTENQQQFLLIAQRNLKRLSSIIDGLLDLSKLESGKLELERVRCSPVQLISAAVETLRSYIEAKALVIDTRIAAGLPEFAVDCERVEQVLTNLLGNAVKFSPHGARITVEADFSRPKNAVVVSVADNGPGIAEEDLSHVFEKFFQSKDAAGGEIGGIRLGLSVVKELVELHGGAVWVESAEGKGAKFSFSIPVE